MVEESLLPPLCSIHGKTIHIAQQKEEKIQSELLQDDCCSDIQEHTQSISAGKLIEDIIFHTEFQQQSQN